LYVGNTGTSLHCPTTTRGSATLLTGEYGRKRLEHSVTHFGQRFARGPTVAMPNVHLDGQSFHHYGSSKQSSGIVAPTGSPYYSVDSFGHHGSNTNNDVVVAQSISTVVGESSNHVRSNNENQDLLVPCGSQSPRTPAVSLSMNPITRNRSIQQTLRTVFPTTLPEVGTPDVSYSFKLWNFIILVINHWM
jgi:hypothetical protein